MQGGLKLKKYDIGTAKCYAAAVTKQNKEVLVILINTSVYVIAADELLSDDEVMILEYVDCTSTSRAYNVWVHMVEDIKMRTFECDYFGGRRNIMSRTLLNILMTEKRFSAIDTMLGLFLENKECKIS